MPEIFCCTKRMWSCEASAGLSFWCQNIADFTNSLADIQHLNNSPNSGNLAGADKLKVEFTERKKASPAKVSSPPAQSWLTEVRAGTFWSVTCPHPFQTLTWSLSPCGLPQPPLHLPSPLCPVFLSPSASLVFRCLVETVENSFSDLRAIQQLTSHAISLLTP